MRPEGGKRISLPKSAAPAQRDERFVMLTALKALARGRPMKKDGALISYPRKQAQDLARTALVKIGGELVMNHAQRLAGLEATAVDMDRLGQPQRARMIRAVLVPYYNWLEDETNRGCKPRETADTIARVLANAVEFFAARVGGNRTAQCQQAMALLNMIAVEVVEQHEGRFNRH